MTLLWRERVFFFVFLFFFLSHRIICLAVVGFASFVSDYEYNDRTRTGTNHNNVSHFAILLLHPTRIIRLVRSVMLLVEYFSVLIPPPRSPPLSLKNHKTVREQKQ